MAALVAGCSVNNQGLSGMPDAAPDVPVDTPAPIVDVGPDLSCGACDSVATFVTLPGGRFTGTTSGDSAIQGTCGGGDAPEAVYKLVLSVKSDLFATTHGTGFNTVLYLRRGCCGTEVACNDDADGRGTSMLAQRGWIPAPITSTSTAPPAATRARSPSTSTRRRRRATPPRTAAAHCRSRPAPRPATLATSRTITARPPLAATARERTAWIRFTTSCSTRRPR